MKKLLVGLLISLGTASAMAQHHGHGHGHGHWHYRGGHNPWVWVAPTIIGGVIGYEIARNQPPQVVVQPQPHCDVGLLSLSHYVGRPGCSTLRFYQRPLTFSSS